ncbi:putative polyketide synthase [Talaromyces proteolyticus]|uniref:Polyketide synthase n=1 Tax=Talaromyces proteolyticus TaxID=1131652 RepID=A0AAD4KDS5_9EURO|nr:putative polyketide synthase [Talaromyces proteolyticus]KAH8688630.1 putative polyketide synthase [Talaromyces proteolyticus]
MGSIEPSRGSDPLAVIGMSCRLPGGNDTPTALWKFLQDNRVASNKVPMSRFDVENHFQGSGRRQPMKSPGAMCLDTEEIYAFDAGFFGISRAEAISMDPQQRHLLEVVYESLENAGISIDGISGSSTGCFVASFTVDYEDMQKREPEHRPPSVITGIGRAILSNRISHYFNLKGPSMSIDTGCSGSLVAVDAACRYISSGDINMAIVAAANVFLSPEHLMNEGSLGFIHSPTGLCHTFDEKADGYVKAEGVNCIILKRLGDALRDCDPIRAVIRGWSTNSDGNTLGISTPDAKSQAACIRSAYRCAGIENLGATSYVECHGTGTPAGDATELKGLSLAFEDVLQASAPLQLGSIKSNIGHSEPAAGLSGLIKAVLCLENGIIPGNPTLLTPHPDLDFEKLRMLPSHTARPWPSVPVRRAGVNSFGYGGSNSHVIVDEATPYLNGFIGTSHVSSYSSTVDIFADDDDESPTIRPYIIPLSGADQSSVEGNCQRLVRHLAHMEVKLKVEDLAYTLAARRTHFPFRAYAVTSTSKLNMESFALGKPSLNSPRIAFVFTGQGAQWPGKLGRDLVRTFPLAENILRQLDRVLQSVENSPSWSLFEKFIQAQDPKAPDVPAISQPLLTAIQIILVCLLESWGICPQSVVGHSAGEVASAYTAGFITKEEAIKIAFYRGHSTQFCQNNSDKPYGMLAVGLGPDNVQEYLQGYEDWVQIACFNSPSSITLSGTIDALVNLKQRLEADKHFCRLLNINKAYHSRFIQPTAEMFADFVQRNPPTAKIGKHGVKMFSTVSGHRLDTIFHNDHWKNNMMLPVQFTQACSDMLSDGNAPTMLIELGPSNALKGPVAQIQANIFGDKSCAQYHPAFVKSNNPIEGIFDLAGCLYLAGAPIALDEVNQTASANPCHIVDLPNYAWDHSIKHWHENQSSKDWRMRLFPHHELLGTKIIGSSWDRPSWKRTFRLCDVSWIKDHQLAGSVLFPGAGYVAMAVEAVRQMMIALDTYKPNSENYNAQFKLRNISFKKALPLNDDTRELQHLLTLQPLDGDVWYGFQISSLQESSWIEHCSGQITRCHAPTEFSSEANMRPLEHIVSQSRCYESFADTGYGYGPTFQKIEAVEVLGGSLEARSLVSLDGPMDSSKESPYPIHPCALDGCLQTIIAASWEGDITSLKQPAVILSIDSLEINEWPLKQGGEVICLSTKEYSGRGRPDLLKSYTGSVLAYRKDDNRLALRAEGLRQAPILANDQKTNSKYHKISWKPDISLADKCLSLSAPTAAGKIQELIDMIIHKWSPSKIAEVNFGQSQEASIWLSDHLCTPREDYKSCSIFYSNLPHLEEARESLGTRECVQIAKFQVDAPEFDIAEELDIIFVSINEPTKRNKVQLAMEKLNSHLSGKGCILLIDHNQVSKTSPVSFEDHKLSDDSENGIINETMCQALSNSQLKFHEILTPQIASFQALFCTSNHQSNSIQNEKYLHIPHFSASILIPEKLRGILEEAGYTMVEHHLPFDKIPRDDLILVLDELQSPLLTNPSHEQWDGLKALTRSNSKLLWVTEESQHKVRQPDTALVHGLFRTIRAENPQCTLITLDLESSAMASLSTIVLILQYLDRPPSTTQLESEFVERGGVIHISRIIPHETEFHHNKEASNSLQGFDDSEKCFGLQCGSLGALDSLEFIERASPMLAVKDGHVEVDIRAVGMNFKDVAIVMGVVDENEHTLGSEGAGVVRRVGADVQDFHIGDRVMLIHSGCLGNRIQVPQGRVQRIPDSISLEDAATMPVCFSTAIYSMLTIGNLRSGQTVLIHSAAGGLGLSCIQVARYIGADVTNHLLPSQHGLNALQIFATVGTQEKVDFLVEEHDIPRDRIFSSRDTQFASAIMKKTRGLGVDLILNTLVGDLLHESWRICADGGIFVELGKRDIRDRKSISMEPFDRNCSFRAVDLSYKQITDELMKGILNRIHDLVIKGHIKPLRPTTLFPFNDVQGAFRYLAKASHIGKVVLSCSYGKSKCMVPIRSAQPNVQLRPDASYLVVGGLKGICGRIAFYMVKAGARHLVIMSRSACDDSRSQSVLARLRHMGCEVVVIRGDVCQLGDVERAITAGLKPVAGIIHGAMVPIGNVFENTSATDFAATIAPKVAGSWNLHTAALNLGLELDFFTMLSSLSAVIGLKGNASYAAGNHFQDALATYRHSLGLAGNAIDLSLVEDVGYMTESTLVKQQVAGEGILVFFKERDLDRIIQDSILEQTTGSGGGTPQLITGLKSPILVTGEGLIYHRDPRFSTIITRDSAKVSGTDSGSGYDDLTTKLIAILQKNDEVKRDVLVTAALNAFNVKLMQVLQTGEETLDPAKSLASYGLDSLSAMQFRNWVQVTLGVEMSTVDITSTPSLHGLTQNFVDRVHK